MKRIALILTFVLGLSFPAFAASNAQPDQLSKKQLAALIATAKTAAEHERIAAYYHTEAERLLTESNGHARMAAAFRSNPATNNDKRANGTVDHCAYLAKSLKDRSDKALSLAEEHERMARAAENK
jgi:uncharacterized protein YciW